MILIKKLIILKANTRLSCALIVNHDKPDLGLSFFNESDTPDGLIEQLLQDLEEGNQYFCY